MAMFKLRTQRSLQHPRPGAVPSFSYKYPDGLTPLLHVLYPLYIRELNLGAPGTAMSRAFPELGRGGEGNNGWNMIAATSGNRRWTTNRSESNAACFRIVHSGRRERGLVGIYFKLGTPTFVPAPHIADLVSNERSLRIKPSGARVEGILYYPNSYPSIQSTVESIPTPASAPAVFSDFRHGGACRAGSEIVSHRSR